jgi:hypothetical protein
MGPPPPGDPRRQQRAEPEPPHPSVAEGGEGFGVDVRDCPSRQGRLCILPSRPATSDPARTRGLECVKRLTRGGRIGAAPIIFRNVCVQPDAGGFEGGPADHSGAQVDARRCNVPGCHCRRSRSDRSGIQMTAADRASLDSRSDLRSAGNDRRRDAASPRLLRSRFGTPLKESICSDNLPVAMGLASMARPTGSALRSSSTTISSARPGSSGLPKRWARQARRCFRRARP